MAKKFPKFLQNIAKTSSYKSKSAKSPQNKYKDISQSVEKQRSREKSLNHLEKNICYLQKNNSKTNHSLPSGDEGSQRKRNAPTKCWEKTVPSRTLSSVACPVQIKEKWKNDQTDPSQQKIRKWRTARENMLCVIGHQENENSPRHEILPHTAGMANYMFLMKNEVC